jgi:hypothetical protein
VVGGIRPWQESTLRGNIALFAAILLAYSNPATNTPAFPSLLPPLPHPLPSPKHPLTTKSLIPLTLPFHTLRFSHLHLCYLHYHLPIAHLPHHTSPCCHYLQ